jgi:acyl-CoA thioesterase FadM
VNLYLRLLYTLVYSFWQGKASLPDEQRLSFRTWPHDLDLNFHMNNGRYLTLMDLGRLQLIVRLGLLGPVLRRHWMPVVGGIQIRFRRSLAPFQAFELGTRIVSWDEKWIYIEQKFYSEGTLIAQAYVKGLIRAREGNVPSATLLAAAGLAGEPPEEVPAAFRP